MNPGQIMVVLRELDVVDVVDAAAPQDVESRIADARNRGSSAPTTSSVEFGAHGVPVLTARRPHRMVAAAVAAALLVVATLSVALLVVGQRHHAAPGTVSDTATPVGELHDTPQVERVSTTESVFPGQHDSLTPMTPDDLVTLDIGQAIHAVRAVNPPAAQFLTDPGVLVVREGLYTNRGLIGADGQPTVDVPVFVISGGTAPCLQTAGKFGASQPATPQPRLCTATLLVSAQSGALLEIGESSLG